MWQRDTIINYPVNCGKDIYDLPEILNKLFALLIPLENVGSPKFSPPTMLFPDVGKSNDIRDFFFNLGKVTGQGGGKLNSN